MPSLNARILLDTSIFDENIFKKNEIIYISYEVKHSYGILYMENTGNQKSTEEICEKYGWNRQKILDNALSEIKERKLKISKDTFRKRIDRCLEKHDQDNAEQDDLYNETSRYVDENVYLRKQLNQLKSENNKLRVKSYVATEIAELLKNEISLVDTDRFNISLKKCIEGDNHLLMPITDVHYGEIIDPLAINEKNSYNTDISKQRHIALIQDAIKAAQLHNCSVLDIPILGDIFSGNIHDELKETNESPITKLLIDYYKFICGLISSLKKVFKEINLYCVVGNHSRINKKWQSKNKSYDNYEYILYCFLKDKFETVDGINVTVSDSTVLFAKIGGMTWKLEHGDAYRGGGAFVSPWGTVSRDNFKDYMIYSELDKKPDAVLMGHWHSAGWLPMQGNNIPIIEAPSLVGPGEFSMLSLHSAYNAAGLLVVIENGEIYSQRIVNLGHIK